MGVTFFHEVNMNVFVAKEVEGVIQNSTAA